MERISIKIEGESNIPHSQTLIFYYRGQLLYRGCGDCFVTTSDDDNSLQLRLNNGIEDYFYYVSARFYNDSILWIPTSFDENYEPMVWSKSDFIFVWLKLGYNFAQDLELISPAKIDNLKAMWLMSSKIKPSLALDLKDWTREIINKLLATTMDSREELKFKNLINENWSLELLKEADMKPTFETNLKVFFDNSNFSEWEALKRDILGRLFIVIDHEVYLEII